MSSSIVSQVATLPKNIQQNIMRFLSLPTADLITKKGKEILQQFLSLNPEERRKYYGVPDILSCLKFKCNYISGTGIAYYDYASCYTVTDTYDEEHILSTKVLKNYGFPSGDKKYKKKMITDYLDINQIEYNPNSQLRTLYKKINSLSTIVAWRDTAERQEQQRQEQPRNIPNTKIIKKKIKLVLVPDADPEPVIRIKVPKKKLRLVEDAN